MDCKCKGCTERHVGCHSECENYITFKEKLEQQNKQIKKEQMKHNLVSNINWNTKRSRT